MFNVLISPKWFSPIGGVEILMAPIDDDALAAAGVSFASLAVRGEDGKLDFEDPDTQKALKAYDRALLASCVRDWRGIGNHDGSAVLELTDEAKVAVVGQPPIARYLDEHFLQPYHYRTAEKNVSSPSQNGISAGESNSASDVSPDPDTDATATESKTSANSLDLLPKQTPDA